MEAEASGAAPAAADFEFNTVSAGVDVKGADDLFFKGQLLPLALPPRMQMVHTLSLLQAQAESKGRECEEAALWPRDGGCPCGDRGCGLRERERGRRCPGVPMRAVLPQVFLAEKTNHSSRDSAWCNRSFWGDSSSQPSDSSADSSSESRDSSGSSKDSVDLSADKTELPGNGSYAGHHKFFQNLVAFGTGAQQQLQLHGRHGHTRMFSWLKPASSRWNGIFGVGKKGAGGSKKSDAGGSKKSEMEEEAPAADSRLPAFFPRTGSPARDSSSSDDMPPPRLRHSGPISVCDDEFLSCKERLSGPLSYRDSFQCDWEGLRASVRNQSLADEKREWQSVHGSFREDREACQPDSKSSSSLVDGHHSGREPLSNGASFRDSSRANSREPVEKRGTDTADKAKRRSLAVESGGRHGYLEKLFRSLHVRSRSTIPLKTGDLASRSKGSMSSRRGSSGALPLLNPTSSTSTELQSSIQGAIAYCKKSQSGCKGTPVAGGRQV